MAKTLKDFLNERQLGPMVVKNPDEQKFIDKHVVAKTADRNGNDDELFKGSKVKMADRPKHRKGYNPGEDEEVYEALKGAQHKIDANKNGKVDAHDFHLLRKKKKVAEAIEELEELDTATLKSYRTKARAQGNAIVDRMKIGGGDWSKDQKNTKTLRKRSAGANMSGKQLVKRGESLKTEEADDPALKFKLHMAKKRQEMQKKSLLAKEEAEQIDELSKKTLGSYVKKAGVNRTHIASKQKSVDDAMTGVSAAMRYVSDTDNLDKSRKQLKKVSNRLDNKDFNRQQGISKAIDRLTKEEAEGLDELSRGTVQRYSMKAKSIADNEGGKDRSKGRELAGRKNWGGSVNGVKPARVPSTNEEAEGLDELSNATLGSYERKSGSDRNRDAGNQMAKRKLLGTNKVKVASTEMNKNRPKFEEVEQVKEKLDMKKASMGTVIKDFQKSDAPQFMGKSQKKRQVMAIAAKLSARDGKPLNKEERLLIKLADLAETHQRTMISVFEKLNEDNQYAFMQVCDTADGIEQMLDFSISYRGE